MEIVIIPNIKFHEKSGQIQNLSFCMNTLITDFQFLARQKNISLSFRNSPSSLFSLKTCGKLFNVIMKNMLRVAINNIFSGGSIEISTSEKSKNLIIDFTFYNRGYIELNKEEWHRSIATELQFSKELVVVLGGEISINALGVNKWRLRLMLIKVGINSTPSIINCKVIQSINCITSPKQIKKTSSNYSKILKIIEQNYSNQNFKSSQIASILHVSLRTLQRNLEKETTLTLNKIIYNYRVFKAKEKLIKGRKITHVAFRCGFSSPSHFTKKFKSITGITPKEFVSLKTTI